MNLKYLVPLAFLTAPAFAADHSHDMHAHGHDHATVAASVATTDAVLNRVDTAKGTINVSHAPIPAFNWPPMTMDLKLADAALAEGIAPGAKVRLSIEKRSAVDYVVVGIER